MHKNKWALQLEPIQKNDKLIRIEPNQQTHKKEVLSCF